MTNSDRSGEQAVEGGETGGVVMLHDAVQTQSPGGFAIGRQIEAEPRDFLILDPQVFSG